MLEACGEEAAIEAEAEEDTGDAPDAVARASLDLRSLPPDVLQVLRAGAVIGSGFEAELLAELLERRTLDILDCLQRAADAGVPIEDRGEARFFLPDDVLGRLLASLLPSLEAAWHRRLGWLLTAAEAPLLTPIVTDDPGSSSSVIPLPDTSMLSTPDTGVIVASADDTVAMIDPSVSTELPAASPPTEPSSSNPKIDLFAEVFEDQEEPAFRPVREPLVRKPAVADAKGPAGSPRATHLEIPLVRLPPPPGNVVSEARIEERAAGDINKRVPSDPARAASHLSAAGQVEAAAQRYATAAGQASAIGAYEQAMAHGRKALRLIESLPTTPERRRFRAQILIALARLQWQAAGLVDGHPDPAFTLDSALETADLALGSIHDDDPLDLIAEAREVAAGVCYDMGTAETLERALDELTRSARLFLSEGQTLKAARLLNDQAAVYVRLGDPVRATHLLSESQTIFEHRAGDDPVTIRELAETHHLLARLPLHAPIRPGRESDAYAMALEHASESESRYRSLGDIREVARVWETMGRLELAGGDRERASERLEAALEVQGQTGDLTGLARSTAALSDVLAAGGRVREALTVLGDSVALNQEKGSPIGLAFNRRSFDALVARLPDASGADDALAQVVEEISGRLTRAEGQLGRVVLPPEPV